MKTLRTLFFLLSFFFYPFSFCLAAAPSFDVQNQTTGESVDTLSFTLSVSGSCTDAIVLVTVGISISPLETISSITVGGVAPTLISLVDSGLTDDVSIALYRLAIGTGSSKTISVTTSGVVNNLVLGATSYCDVHQTASVGTAATNYGAGVSPATVDVSSALGETVIDAVLGFYSGTIAADQTERINVAQGTIMVGTSEDAGASTVTKSWTITGDQYWYIIGVSLKPVTVTVTAPRRRPAVVVQ